MSICSENRGNQCQRCLLKEFNTKLHQLTAVNAIFSMVCFLLRSAASGTSRTLNFRVFDLKSQFRNSRASPHLKCLEGLDSPPKLTFRLPKFPSAVQTFVHLDEEC